MKAFFENNQIAYVEGTPEEMKRFLPNGPWVDLSTLPRILGENVAERLEKFLKYKDMGILLVESDY
jgi:hypothetical protein